MKQFLEKYQNIFHSKLIKIFLTFLFFSFFFSCDTSQDNIPYIYVDIYIDLNKPEFFELNAIGNYVYITGGYQGIIVYRSSLDEFFAYERTCSYDIDCRVDVDEKTGYMIDTCCGSEFSLSMDGVVAKGPATLPLRKYKAIYYPNNKTLRITN